MRIGAVSYLNTKPLVHGIPEDDGRIDLCFDLPSRLADDLAAARLDVALIPVIESVSDPDYTIVSDACIACRGPVWSVKLLSRVPFADIRTLALDEGSRTSATLVQILLARLHAVRPELSNFPIGTDPQATETDAVLVIGDRAMKQWGPDFPYRWDLGEEWLRLTRLPFVFAVWTARQSESLTWVETVLGSARDRGLEALEQIAAKNAATYGLTRDKCLDYFRRNLHFKLGAAERRGLREFLSEAKRLEIIPPYPELRFHDCQATG